MIDNVHLTLEMTWRENSETGYDRVAIMGLRAMGDSISKIREHIIDKIKQEIGLVYDTDFILHDISDPPAYVLSPHPIYINQKITLRLKEEEHFTMLKLHYDA
jgi:hypothetical protein